MVKLIISLLLLLSIQCFAIGQSQEEMLFQESSVLLQDSNYVEALSILEGLEKQGVESLELYANLGYAYHKTGLKGKAILSFEKALALAPLDAEILHNSRIVSGKSESINSGLAFFTDADFILRAANIGTKAAVLLLLLSAIAFALNAFKVKIPLYFSLRKICKATVITASLLFSLSLTAVLLLQMQTDAVIVVKAAGRSGPSPNAKIISELAEGEKLKVKKSFRGWYKVEKPDGTQAWVDKSSIGLLNE